MRTRIVLPIPGHGTRLAAAVSAATRIAAERWLRPDPESPFSAMLLDDLTWITPAMRSADNHAESAPETPRNGPDHR